MLEKLSKKSENWCGFFVAIYNILQWKKIYIYIWDFGLVHLAWNIPYALCMYEQKYILSKKYRELIIQKARLKRLSKTFLTLSWHHCPSYWRRVRAQNRRKRADLWEKNSWILHHDNAPSHKAIIVNEFLAKNSTNIIEQPPYSSDMAPADFFFFPKRKLSLRGTRFQSIENIKENSRRELKSIPENAFKKCFYDWIVRWHKCTYYFGRGLLKAIK